MTRSSPAFSRAVLVAVLLLLLTTDASSSSSSSSSSPQNRNSNNNHPSPPQFHVESALELPSKRHQLYHPDHHHAVSSSSSYHLEDDAQYDAFRGGASNKPPHHQLAAMKKCRPPPPPQTTTPTKKRTPTATWISASLATLVLSVAVYSYRDTLAPLLDKHYIQEHTLVLLQNLQQRPGAIYLYVLGMAAWEFLGLSTIPVETAAGMVFGLQTGFWASGGGKLLGAFTAFGLGRYGLAHFVATRLDNNPVWKTLNKSTDVHSPLQVALLMKFSCFPEMIKNFGSACLTDISFITFALATMVHGLLFTFVWTYLGVDTAKRLEAAPELLPMNWRLQSSLIAAAIAGLVVSPLLMAWWIRDMKRRATDDSIDVAAKKNNNNRPVVIGRFNTGGVGGGGKKK